MESSPLSQGRSSEQAPCPRAHHTGSPGIAGAHGLLWSQVDAAQTPSLMAWQGPHSRDGSENPGLSSCPLPLLLWPRTFRLGSARSQLSPNATPHLILITKIKITLAKANMDPAHVSGDLGVARSVVLEITRSITPPTRQPSATRVFSADFLAVELPRKCPHLCPALVPPPPFQKFQQGKFLQPPGKSTKSL